MIIKDIIFQNKKDRNQFLKDRLQHCYTPLYLKLRTKTDFSVGFLEQEINEIIIKSGYLLDIGLVNDYTSVFDKEKSLLGLLKLNEEIMAKIDKNKELINDLDKDDELYDKYFEMYINSSNDSLKQAEDLLEIYGNKEGIYIRDVNDFRKKLEQKYSTLIEQYYRHFKTKI